MSEQRPSNTIATPSDDMNLSALKKKAQDARVAAMTAEEELRVATNRLEGAASAVCSTCLRLRYSVEFGYTYCPEIGDVSGRWQALSSIARLEGGKFICSRFKEGGELRGSP